MKKLLLILFVFLITIYWLGAQNSPKYIAPDFSLKTYDGETIALSKYRGKIVMINFWATWCRPCRAEIPDFIEVYSKYKGRGFEIIGIALDKEGWTKVKPFIDKNNINYPIVLGNADLVQKYGGIQSIPTTYIVDKKGYLIAGHIGLLKKEALEKYLESVLD